MAAAALSLAVTVQTGHGDGELIGRVGAGDRNAFEELFHRYSRPVYGLALRRLGDQGRAEDALQDTFTRVWRSARTYRSDRGSGATWLFAIARNAIADAGRTRVEPTADVPEEPSPEPGPAERVESSWIAWRVWAALARLPAHERRLLELAYWSGLSQSEIAGELDIPLGTVKTRTRTALARLARELEGEL